MLKRTILLAFITFIISGCQVKTEDKPGINLKPANNEVVSIHGSMQNIERLDLFVENVKNDKQDKIRLTQYTIEGDPIFQDLSYDGSKISVKYDSTEDKFGGGEVRTDVCKSIQKKESETETKYILDECPNFSDLLTISHDVDKQDNFAFDLKYGVGKKNEINTKDQELIKDLQNGEMVAVKDFQFSKAEMNKIYKLMIFSNYLEEKKLSTKCNMKPYVSYELKVWINDDSRHFEWSECDKSKDGKEMSKLVQNILAVLKNNATYQALPKDKGSNE
ncbi:DUF4362 domain-containing protein [Neobacillus sp. NRS-1170]|uniref:DUF4362 domain-containing protein n=1 Tax=Neobacillus sp. NRS-1170 TaxID=3233898 RepID=UPI003D2722A7